MQSEKARRNPSPDKSLLSTSHFDVQFRGFAMVTVVAIETEQQIFGSQQHLSPRSPVKNVWEQAPAHQAAVAAAECSLCDWPSGLPPGSKGMTRLRSL